MARFKITKSRTGIKPRRLLPKAFRWAIARTKREWKGRPYDNVEFMKDAYKAYLRQRQDALHPSKLK